jgi:ATP-dependent RNA helicase RhlE
MTFKELNLIPTIQSAIDNEGYTSPTPIQKQAIPLALAGHDILGCAQTGTGKTAAFTIPILQLLSQRENDGQKRRISALILTPTRELAIQIGQSIAVYGKQTDIRHTVIYGGVKQHQQVSSLKNGVDILVATPGRLLDLMGQNYVKLSSLQFFVLDEADRMLDMGFVHDVKRVIQVLPKKRQSLFFSATMPKEIIKLADEILVAPKKIEVTPASTTAETVGQKVYFVDKENKRKLLTHLINSEEIERAIVFTRTKHGADRVAKSLQKDKISAEAIHGNKSQNARQKALNNFKNSATRILVATDIAARGIDIDDLTHMFNFELPNVAESYVHRIGRTGRAGGEGNAISFCDAEERAYLKDIEKLIGFSVEVVKDHPYPLVNEHPAPAKRTPRPSRNNPRNKNPQRPKSNSR